MTMTTSSTVVIIEVCPGSGYDTWNLNQTVGAAQSATNGCGPPRARAGPTVT